MSTVYYNDIDPYCCAVLNKNIERGYLPQGDVDGRDIRDVRAEQLVGYQHIHLFAGIGGFPLGMARAGYPTSLRTLTGGFPCQPHSFSGKRQASTDERNLWGEMYNIIRTVRPDYVLGENVVGLLSSENGRFFGGILRDMARIRYDVEWQVLSSRTFGAVHKRKRLFLVAYPHAQRWTRLLCGEFAKRALSSIAQSATPLDTPSTHLSQVEQSLGQPAICRSNDGLSRQVDRLGALGNSVDPRITSYIASCIVAYEQSQEAA